MSNDICIDNVPQYLTDHEDTKSDDLIVNIVRNVVTYLRVYKVAPSHYKMNIYLADKQIQIQIDEQGGRIDKQVSKTKFEFINGVSFFIDFDELPSIEECRK